MKAAQLALLILIGCGSGLRSDPTGVGTVTSGLTDPVWLAQDSSNLYVVEQISTGYKLLRVAKTGGTAQVLATDPVIEAVIADDAGVYWIGFDGSAARVLALAHGATTPVELGRSNNGFNGSTLRNMTIDAQAVYFSDEQGSIWRVPKAGGGAIALGMTDSTAGAIATDSDGVWVSTLHGAKHITTTGVARELAFAQRPPDALASDGNLLFAMCAGSGFADGSIVRVSLTDSPVTLTSTLILPTDIKVADGHLYIATANEDSAIRMLPESGGEPVLLAQAHQDGRGPGALAVDDAFIYWTETYLGEIRKIAR
ncbi:MAG: hypothetical protein JWO36_3020 [Myxococcales bacterium]|nr:hypothetical protein [Myxococcales bacterium]